MWVKKDQSGMAALPDGTTYEWKKDGDTIEIPDEAQGAALCEIDGFTEMVDGKPVAKRARKQPDAGGVSVVGEPQAPIPATVVAPEPVPEAMDVTVTAAPDSSPDTADDFGTNLPPTSPAVTDVSVSPGSAAPLAPAGTAVPVEQPAADSMAPPLMSSPPPVSDPAGGQPMGSPLTADQSPAGPSATPAV